MDILLKEGVKCYHCGDLCANNEKHLIFEGKHFCCAGCRMVFEILEQNNLCKYYSIDNNPGISQKKAAPELKSRYAYLDDQLVSSQLLDFTENKVAAINFHIPHIHCSSCIWLLENLHKLNKGVIHSEVNFMQKSVYIRFNMNEISLRSLVELLVSIGYEPQINLGDTENKIKYRSNKKLYYKIGIAGFCFGNIMLLSFPEYLTLDGYVENLFKTFFGALNILLAVPVIFYCASDYFKSALRGIKQRTVNIDFPISLGLAVLFIRSVYEIISGTGPGFFDSMSGLVFFLLAGKVFQSKTFDALNFERNYKSYFPVSVTVKKNSVESSIPVSKLRTGNRIIIRRGELIPADAILFSSQANIDYSFVTGESIPVAKVAGEIIYAGGRQTGSIIELEIIRTVSQSYLTQLWNNDSFVKKDENRFNSMVNVVGKYFTVLILLVAAAAFFYWLPASMRTAINAFTAVLIVACPCGIALTSPFALGNAMRILGKNKLYVKNASVVERLSAITSVVFDKTGTITQTGDSNITFNGSVLSSVEQKMVKALVHNSTHPLSSRIYDAISENDLPEVKGFLETVSKGIEGWIDHKLVRIGAALFVADKHNVLKYSEKIEEKHNSKIFLSINGSIKGYFSVNNTYRAGLGELTSELAGKYELSVISGDNDGERDNLNKYFNSNARLFFNQSPLDKLEYVKVQQKRGKKVLMIGDGLNDAGALKQSDVGLAISEDVSCFSPSCDAIMDASIFSRLTSLIKFTGTTKKIIIISFIISVIYNIAGVSLAFSSSVSPLMAAILMPLSSVTVVLFTVISTNLMAQLKGLA